MTKYARVVGGVVIEPPLNWNDVTPAAAFPPDIAAEHVECPAEVEQGWTFDGENWAAPVDPELPPPNLPAYAAAKRFAIETGGVVVAGATIATDRESQAMIAGAFAYSQVNPATMIQFKAAGGFVSLDAAQVLAIATAVGAHVQECFAAEAAVLAEIDAETVTTITEIDEHPAWPA